MTNEEFQRSKSFEENLKEWNLLSLEEMGESVKEGSLYVIGNGFDMLHGVRSSYYDFSRTLGKKSSVRFYLEKYLKTDDLWADFEGALGKICFLYNKNTNYCRGQSSKLQREFPYYCRVLFGIFLSPQFL